jgi:hypothetical protein
MTRRYFNCFCGAELKEGEDRECGKCKSPVVQGALLGQRTGVAAEPLIPQDQLKQIVEQMREGWELLRDCTISYWLELKRPDGKTEPLLCIDYTYTKPDVMIATDDEIGKRFGDIYYFTFPDLITNPAAIGALVGNGIVCDKCGSVNYKSTTVSCARCSKCSGEHFVEAYIYHGLKAAEILLSPDGSTEKAINYLWEEMKK